MSTEEIINHGGPAFPVPSGDRRLDGYYDGLTMRDYFAAKAMPEFIALYVPITNKGETPKEALRTIAEASYNMADAMLKARDGK